MNDLLKIYKAAELLYSARELKDFVHPDYINQASTFSDLCSLFGRNIIDSDGINYALTMAAGKLTFHCGHPLESLPILGEAYKSGILEATEKKFGTQEITRIDLPRLHKLLTDNEQTIIERAKAVAVERNILPATLADLKESQVCSQARKFFALTSGVISEFSLDSDKRPTSTWYHLPERLRINNLLPEILATTKYQGCPKVDFDYPSWTTTVLDMARFQNAALMAMRVQLPETATKINGELSQSRSL